MIIDKEIQTRERAMMTSIQIDPMKAQERRLDMMIDIPIAQLNNSQKKSQKNSLNQQNPDFPNQTFPKQQFQPTIPKSMPQLNEVMTMKMQPSKEKTSTM